MYFGDVGVLFRDRFEAGERLAERFTDLRGVSGVLLLAIPRGGVEVGYAMARQLGLPLEVYLTRKIGAPGNPELALGAVASNGTLVLDRDLILRLGVDQDYVDRQVKRQQEEIGRRLEHYGGKGLSREELEGQRLVIVDDGVATGSTMLAGIRALRQTHPAELMVGIPVGPPETVQRFRAEVDRLECLAAPEQFLAVGRFYESFEQTTDEDVVRLLEDLRKS